MQDRRKTKTQTAIKSIFLELLQSKKIEQITVSEICKLADIGRGTFYLHYNDVYDLYEKIEYGYIKGMDIYFIDDTLSLDEKIEQMATYICKNRVVIESLSSTNRWRRSFEESFYGGLLRKYYNGYESSNYGKAEARFIAGGVSSVIEDLCKSNSKMNAQELSRIFLIIINKFSNP